MQVSRRRLLASGTSIVLTGVAAAPMIAAPWVARAQSGAMDLQIRQQSSRHAIR